MGKEEEGSNMGPLRDPVKWYGIRYAGTQVKQRDFQSKGIRTSPARLSFVLKVSLCNLRPSIISSVPCDRSCKGPIIPYSLFERTCRESWQLYSSYLDWKYNYHDSLQARLRENYKIFKTVRAFSLVDRYVQMRVCEHGCDVTLSVFPPPNFKPFQRRQSNS